MSESPVSTWNGTESDGVADNFFKIFEVNETDSKFNDSGDLLENETAYLDIQHDTSIKIDRIVPSCGSVSASSYTLVARSIPEQEVQFWDNQPHELKYQPVRGSVTGLWYLSPPIPKAFGSSGTPTVTIDGRSITAGIESFGGPAPAVISYKAEFKRYRYNPPATSLETSDNTWPVSFQVYYSKV